MLYEDTLSFVRRSNRTYDDTISEKSLQSVDDIFHDECGLSDISKERWWTSRESVALRNQTLFNTVYIHNNVLSSMSTRGWRNKMSRRLPLY